MGRPAQDGPDTFDHRDEHPEAEHPDESPMSVFDEEQPSRRWPRTLGLLLAVLVVLGGVYVGALWFLQDRVPPGTTVAGVAVGGLPAVEAVSTLETSLSDAATEPVPVVAGERRAAVDPGTAGLRFDAQATVDSVTGFGLEPERLWRHVVGAGEVQPVTQVDTPALRAAVAEVAEAVAVEPVEGDVVFVDGQAQGTQVVAGSSLDRDGAMAAVVDGWLTERRPLPLPTVVTEPAVGQEEVDRVVEEVARPLADAPVSVAVGDQLAELPVEVVTAAASFVPENGTLRLEMDGEALVAAVLARTTDLLSEPVDARFDVPAGAAPPTIVPGVPGTSLDPDALADAVAAAGTNGTDRTARVSLVETEPARSTADLEALGITTLVSEFATPLTSEPRRTANIVNGAAKINGTLVMPDEVFSLTEALGPVDAEHGFVEAGAIVNGEHVDAWGGGLSQVSTTTYNAAYFAGYEDVEHHPHSEWFPRYPEGREATIYTGSLDMRFRNDTPHASILQAYVEGGQLHVRIWGTPYWTVESDTSGRSDVVQPTTVRSDSPTCEPQDAGSPGFTVTVTRRILLEGVEHDTQTWKVRYRPQNEVICVPPGTPTEPGA